MRWPWQRGETRQDSATALAIATIESQAHDEFPNPERLAACRAVAGLYASAFAGARIEGATLGSAWLPLAVRSMLLQGESLHVLELRGGRFSLVPAVSWDVTGGPHPETWRYRADLSGPSGSEVRTRGLDGLAWLPWEASSLEPWRGRGPWYDSDSFRALVAIERASEGEGRSPSAHVAAVPRSMPEDVRNGIRAALSRARGSAVLLDSLKDFGAQGETMTRFQRIGFDAPQTLPILRRQLEESVAAAAGVPGELLYVSPGGGSGAREAFRRWYHVAIVPLARRIEDELSRVLERDVALNLRDLGAADVAGRARAYAALVSAEMEPARAAEISGVG